MRIYRAARAKVCLSSNILGLKKKLLIKQVPDDPRWPPQSVSRWFRFRLVGRWSLSVWLLVPWPDLITKLALSQLQRVPVEAKAWEHSWRFAIEYARFCVHGIECLRLIWTLIVMREFIFRNRMSSHRHAGLDIFWLLLRSFRSWLSILIFARQFIMADLVLSPQSFLNPFRNRINCI
jgi:hypothetical protein